MSPNSDTERELRLKTTCDVSAFSNVPDRGSEHPQTGLNAEDCDDMSRDSGRVHEQKWNLDQIQKT